MAADLPTKKYLNLAAIKKMVAAAEAEMQKRNVHVTICIVDDGGHVIFLQKADGATMNTLGFAEKKAQVCGDLRAALEGGRGRAQGGKSDLTGGAGRVPEPGRAADQSRRTDDRGDRVQRGDVEEDEAISQAAIDALMK